MVIKAQENVIGARAFLIGIILAILVGILTFATGSGVEQYIFGILIILGLIIGIFIDERNVQTILFASVSIVLVCYAGIQGQISRAVILGFAINQVVNSILGALLFLFIPVTIVVALKTVYSLAKS